MVQKKWFTFKIRAGVLPFTLAICLVMSVICASTILLAYYKNLLFTQFRIEQQLQNNVHSAMALALAEVKDTPYGESRTLSLFGKGNDSVSIEKRAWGIYDQLLVGAYSPRHSLHQHCLVGLKSTLYDGAALFLRDNREPLSIAGNTTLRGHVLVPKQGIKPGYVNNTGYTGSRLIYGSLGESTETMPPIAIPFLNTIANIQPTLSYQDQLKGKTALRQDFHQQTLVIGEPGLVHISHSLKGNIMVVSAEAIHVESTSILEDVILHAPKIIIKSGFNGSVQLFATDTVLVGAGVQLHYPSNIVTYAPKERSFIQLEAGSKLEGGVYQTEVQKGKEVFHIMEIGEKAQVTGQVYATGSVELEGVVQGQLLAAKVHVSNELEHFNSYLLNAIIDKGQLPTSYLYPSVWEGEGYEPLKWLD